MKYNLLFRLLTCVTCYIPFLSAAEPTPQQAPNASCKVINPRGYAALFAEKAPVIDGKIDDAVWQLAPWTDSFVDIQGEARPLPRFQTRAKMAWDDTFFYIAAHLEEPHVWATLTQHDSVIFQDNDFEIFIDPDGDNHQYLEFEINALNTEWDLRLPKAYRDGGPALNEWEVPGLKTAVFVHGTLNNSTDLDKGWSVEWAIPWKALAEFAGRRCPPQQGDIWRVNFSRVQWRHQIDRDGKYQKIKGYPEENWVWSPQGRIDMHRPELWGHVKFVKTPAEVALPVIAEDQAARWWLLEVYDAQKTYQAREKKYSPTLEALELKTPVDQSWSTSLEPRQDLTGYVATVTIPRPGKKPLTLKMHQDSKIVRTPGWNNDSP